MSGIQFQADSGFEAAHPTALAIYCSDGRFTRAVEELLLHLGHRRLDVLTHPGGPALLAPRSTSYSEREGIRRAADFLIHKHAITDVVLLAHEGCGYYRDRHAGQAAAAIHERQIDDLRQAAEALAGTHLRLSLRRFHARVEDGRVRFVEIGSR